MARAPFQILVIPYRRRHNGLVEYAVLERMDHSMWQFIAGGGEDGETPKEAAVREAQEEALVPAGVKWMALDSLATIPRDVFSGGTHWPPNLYVVPEHCFAVELTDCGITLSAEHGSLAWLEYEQARQKLAWQSNQNALWELRERLRHSDAK